LQFNNIFRNVQALLIFDVVSSRCNRRENSFKLSNFGPILYKIDFNPFGMGLPQQSTSNFTATMFFSIQTA